MSENTSPKISITMAAYNHAPFVGRAIESVLEQTYKDFEFVIVDDGSTDGTAEIIQKYNDPRIRFFAFEKNRGANIATRKIHQEAKGKYYAGISSDDAFLPQKLEKQLPILEANPNIGAVFTYPELIDEKGQPYMDEKHVYSTRFEQPNKTRAQWLSQFFTGVNCFCHPTVMIRKECYEKVGAYDFRYAQLPDLDMWIRLLFEYDVHIIAEKLAQFRILDNKKNISAATDINHVRSHWELSHILEEYTKIKDVSFFREIFPDCGIQLFNNESRFIPFLTALRALKIKNPAHHLFAMNQLYKLMADTTFAEELEERFHFTYNDYLKLSGEYNIFAVKRNEIRQYFTPKPVEEKECNLCGWKGERFAPMINAGGGRRDDARCPQCGCFERHRALVYFWENHHVFQKDTNFIEFGPVREIEKYIKSRKLHYFSCDLFAPADIKANIEHLPMGDNTVDHYLNFHVLEHIFDDLKALLEMIRTLKPGGKLFLSIPLKIYNQKTIEYLQPDASCHDHWRDYGVDFELKLNALGLNYRKHTMNHIACLKDSERYGFRQIEDILFIVEKPDNWNYEQSRINAMKYREEELSQTIDSDQFELSWVIARKLATYDIIGNLQNWQTLLKYYLSKNETQMTLLLIDTLMKIESSEEIEEQLFQWYREVKKVHTMNIQRIKKGCELVRNALHNRDFDQALELIRELLQIDPQNPEIVYLSGKTLWAQGAQEGAVSLLSQIPADSNYYDKAQAILDAIKKGISYDK